MYFIYIVNHGQPLLKQCHTSTYGQDDVNRSTNNDFVSMCGYFVNNKIMWRMYPYLANVHFIHTDNDNDCINDFIW